MSARRWVLLVIVVSIGGGIWWVRRRPVRYPDAYVADRSATLWSATAQVRRQVATLGYGDKVSVLGRAGELTQVRALNGTAGWIDSRLLMAPALWNRVGQLLSEARDLPVQASGHTKTISNVHIDPGRDSPRIFQFGRNIPVVILRRQVAATGGSGGEDGRATEEPPASSDEKSNLEDWSLVLYWPAKQPSIGASVQAGSGPAIPIAGWILSRFVDLDPPSPLGDYVGAAGRRIVAWEQLDTVPDPSGDKAQYVVAATKGGEGQPCDFTSIRVYTWGAKRMQYETSFADNNVCGRLPLNVTATPAGPEFRFEDAKSGERAYRLMGTVVRRLTPNVPARKPK